MPENCERKPEAHNGTGSRFSPILARRLRAALAGLCWPDPGNGSVPAEPLREEGEQVVRIGRLENMRDEVLWASGAHREKDVRKLTGILVREFPFFRTLKVTNLPRMAVNVHDIVALRLKEEGIMDWLARRLTPDFRHRYTCTAGVTAPTSFQRNASVKRFRRAQSRRIPSGPRTGARAESLNDMPVNPAHEGRLQMKRVQEFHPILAPLDRRGVHP